jgi:aspartate/methionine/tyrosine aminotransferase
MKSSSPPHAFVAYQAEVILAGGTPIEIPSRNGNQFQPDPVQTEQQLHTEQKYFIWLPPQSHGRIA